MGVYFTCMVVGDRGSETPTSRTFYFRFPPPSIGVLASLFYFSCKMLHNIAKFSFFSPGSCHFGNSTSRPLSSHLPYPSCPLFSRAPAHLSPSTVWCHSALGHLHLLTFVVWSTMNVNKEILVFPNNSKEIKLILLKIRNIFCKPMLDNVVTSHEIPSKGGGGGPYLRDWASC